MHSTDAAAALPPKNKRPLHWGLAIGITGLALCLAILYWFEPAAYSFYPRCMLYRLTGLQCPGCGSLRAIHCLLHGEVAMAFRLNALLVCSVPVVLFMLIRLVQRKPAMPAMLVWVGLAAALIFGVARNLASL